MENARQIAWEVLTQCVSAERYSNLALDTAIKRSNLNTADRGLLTTLVYGVMEKQIPLDACINSLVRQNSDIPINIRALLRLGIYQILYLDRVPDHAAVNETVNLAPKRYKGFVNALLRAFLRGGKRIPLPNRECEPLRYLSVKYSFCEELCEKFVAEFGFFRTESLFAAFGVQPSVTLRVNTLKTSREEYAARLGEAELLTEFCRESGSGLHLLSKAPVSSLYGFEEGLFFVQDEASQLCVEALDAREGMRILDTCACPGSKAFGAAITMKNQGSVVACDLHGNKLSLIESGGARLGISILQTVQRDAREPNDEWVGSFDRVLCDVPCSGFGVFAKKPELRYKNPEKSEQLPQIQLDILTRSADFVKEGGRLVYSTCTLIAEENERNVARFLAQNKNFVLWNQRTLYPDTDGCDGFYFAVLERIRN